MFCGTAVAAEKYEPLVIRDDNASSAHELLNKGGFPFAVLQVTSPGVLTKDSASALVSYVKGGGTVWFYDSRLAPLFGMTNSPMNIKGLETKGMEAEFGSGKMTGAAVGAVAVKGASPVRGIRRAAVFVILLGEDTYSAVRDSGVTPLLKVPGQKSLVGAVKKLGNGKAIFKPLLWEQQYDGAAFQRKLIRYSRKEG